MGEAPGMSGKENIVEGRLRHRAPFGVLLALAFGAFSAAGQSVTDGTGQPRPAPSPEERRAMADRQLSDRVTPSAFGTSSFTIYQIPAAAFHGRASSATLDYQGTGLVQGNLTGYNYWAPVFLPTGALIYWIDLFACDSNASSHMTAYLTGYSGSTSPSTTDINPVSSTNIGGCGYWASPFGSIFVPAPHQVVNDVQYGNGYHYVINFSFGAADNTNRLKGVDLWWKRQISPAPATATFSDVPTSFTYFRAIEALAASGITGGCGGSNFCPNGTVTRGEMAAFLARALGLHFPY